MESGFFVETKDIVFLVIAGYAALVSTVALGRAVLRDRRRVKVSGTVQIAVSQVNVTEYLAVEAVNSGQRSVTIRNLTWKLPDGQSLVPTPSDDPVILHSNTTLPIELVDGATAKMFIDKAKVVNVLRDRNYSGAVVLVPQATDSVGKTFVGKGLELKI